MRALLVLATTFVTGLNLADDGAADEGLSPSPQRQYRALRREVLRAEREALMLDLEETRLEQIDTGGNG